ncbi:unnamed protein product [Toxocara canis]|uniref:Major sperm protein n=1 Tax=Toxocara canis TaxID=6265 RepID=A0A183V943_TOXCA|nr:unnamed protein product [Toxocara canis]
MVIGVARVPLQTIQKVIEKAKLAQHGNEDKAFATLNCFRNYRVQITNACGRRIGRAIKTTNMRRLGVDPPCGMHDQKDSVLMVVSCDTFNAATEDLNNDRISIEWTNTPDDAAKPRRNSTHGIAPIADREMLAKRYETIAEIPSHSIVYDNKE